MQTSLLTRPDENIFASGAHSGEVRNFPDILRGWGLTFDDPADGGNGGFPPMEWFNALLERIDAATQYFLQRGVAEWASTTLYAPGSVVSRNALVFRALRSNQNVTPGTDAATWAQLADQTIAAVAAPPGMFGLFPMGTVPAGWLKMNGASLSRVTYSALFAAIGTTYGAADASTFSVPDVRGDFVRCWDDGRGIDRGRALGTVQDSAFTSHQHGGTALWVGDHAHGASAWTDAQGWHGHAVSDPGHAHAVADSGHAHNFTVVANNGDSQGVGHLTGGSYNSPGDGSYTGVTAPSGAGIGIYASGSNIGIFGDGLHAHNVGVSIAGAGGHQHSLTTDWQGTSETRPRNTAFMACIKY